MTKMNTEYTEVPVSAQAPETDQVFKYKVYPRRWFMLGIFMVFSFANAVQWLQYCVITNVITKFYNVSSYAVDWTSIGFMVICITLAIPATHCVNKYGIRKSILVGAGLLTLGSWIKCASVSPELYWVTIFGHLIAGLAQLTFLQMPPYVASVWFGSNQVSTACSLGIFGAQLGLAINYLVTPMVVGNHSNLVDIGTDLSRLFYVLAGFNTVIFLLVAIWLQDKPPLPPSIEEAKRIGHAVEFLAPFKRLYRNKNFMLLLLTYSIIIGIFNAFATLISQFVLIYFENDQEFAGRVGLIFIIGGMIGSVMAGYIMDRTRRFKETNVVLNALTTVFMLIITFVVNTGSVTAIYIISGILGACFGGDIPAGFEFASELTYPESEGTTAGILIAVSSVGAGGFTWMYAWLFEVVGDVWANIIMTISMVIGTGITAVIKSDLRRQAAHAPVTNDEKDADS